MQQVKAGVSRAKTAGEEIKTIVSGISREAELVTEIARCAREQGQACHDAAAGIDDIRSAAREAAAAASQAASASSELSIKSEQLDSMVRKFKLNRRIVKNGPPNDDERRHAKQRAATKIGKLQHAGEKQAGSGGC